MPYAESLHRTLSVTINQSHINVNNFQFQNSAFQFTIYAVQVMLFYPHRTPLQ
jgi:hypothetical protein